MKKISILLMALLVSTMINADPIILTPNTYPDVSQGKGHRTPALIPEFYLDGYTLTAGSYTVGSTVVLKDADDNVVFTSYIYMEGDTIVLPATLTGTYTIEVTLGDITFVGEIEL